MITVIGTTEIVNRENKLLNEGSKQQVHETLELFFRKKGKERKIQRGPTNVLPSKNE